MKENKLVSSCTTWFIHESRYASENVFTIPEYRRKGIGRETLHEGLRSLQKQGATEATLTVVEQNRPAIQMFTKMGYHLAYNMFEMHYK